MVITNQRERDGCGVHFCYRVHHLQQWADQLAIFKARVATNPFAVVALAQLAAHRRTSDPERKASKREIIWLLYESGYGRDDVLALLRFIDWMLRLPPALELELRGELTSENGGMSHQPRRDGAFAPSRTFDSWPGVDWNR